MSSIGKRSPELAETTVLSRRTATAELPRVTVILRWAIGILGVAILAWFYLQRPPISLRYFWIYTAAFVILQTLLAIRIAPSARFHLGFTFLIVYFQLVGGVAAATLIAVDRLITWVIQRLSKDREETLLSLFFDIGRHILAVLSGALLVMIFLQLPAMELSSGVRPLLSMLLFAGGYVLGHSTLTSVAVYSRFGFFDLRTRLWPATVLWTGLSVLSSLPLAIITWNLIGAFEEGWAAIIMLALTAAVSLILRLNAGLMKINREQKALNTIGNLLNSTLSTRELFSILATEIRQVLSWDRFFIALRNDEGSTDLVFVDASGSQTAPRTVPKGIGLTGRAMATGEVVHYEAERGHGEGVEDFETSTGRRRPRSIVVAPMRFGDAVIGAIGVQSFRPDSYGKWHFRLLETVATQAASAIRNAQLFESEQLANQERDEFVSVVTHEIKSPLTSIRGYVDLAKHSIANGDQASAIESLSVVKGEAGKILRLVEDLLDASKMDAGHFSLEVENVELEPIIRSIIDRYRRTATQSIEFRNEGTAPSLEADPLRIGQVIENLISNACKYSRPESTIVVTLADRTDVVEIVVSDDGDGIEPAKLPLIFERFYRAREGDAEVKGTGLGLYITRQIVAMHGGSIEVESKPGVGTTFTVSMPIRMAG